MTTQGPPRPPSAGGGGPILNGRQLAPAEVQQRMEEEAKKHGLTLPQFIQIQRAQQQRLEQEAAKAGMTPQQFIQKQQEFVQQESAKLGITPQQFIAMKQQEAIKMQQAAQAQAQAAQQGGAAAPGQAQQMAGAPPGLQQTQMRIDLSKPVEPKPDALAVAKFLRAQDLKCRTCIFDGQRKDMFKVKRAFRAFMSPAYTKARAKDPLLPEIKTPLDARNALQLLPLNMLALRIQKKDHTGHDHGKKKRVKGLWDVGVHAQQDFEPMMHYMWIYEQPSIKTKVYSILALIAVFTVVLFPLWPMKMRQGVWYLSVGAMGLLGAFFAMAIFRLILFCVTVFAVSPGLWLFPNLFEDVGFWDSFKPVWGWHGEKKKKKSKKAVANGSADKGGTGAPTAIGEGVVATTTSGAQVVEEAAHNSAVTKRHAAPTVEDGDGDDE